MTRTVLALGLTLLLAGSLLTGCLQSGEVNPAGNAPPAVPPIDADWVLRALMPGEDHKHDDVTQHQNLTTPNFQVIGYDPLVSGYYGATPTGMGCGGVGTTAEGRRIAVVHTISTDVAFVVADVTDPVAPKMLGEYLLPNVVVWDATVTPDGMHALVGADLAVFKGGWTPKAPVPATLLGDRVKVQPLWRDACTGETRAAGPEQYLPVGGSIVMVGLQDPTSPTFEDVVAQPIIGPHSVTAHLIDGVMYATASVTNLVHEASYYTIFTVEGTPAGSRLVPHTVLPAPGIETTNVGLNGHVDLFLQKHPLTGKVLAYLANWDAGMTIVDITTPGRPVILSTWRDGDEGSLHTTYPLPTLWADGKHYTIAGQEVGPQEDKPTGWVYIIDTTDPAAPQEVGRWTLPMKPQDWPGGLMFSPHYVEVVNQTMFVTNYHGGLWAVSLANLSAPDAVGLFVPDRVSPKPLQETQMVVVEDVIAGPDGILTLWDGAGGIYLVRFDETNPAPAPARFEG
ncbi:MAG TPA: hypothetical protein VNZ52_14220 [Candidatus Thermoplasmatota archaeon]|nr:hypothetical protein [Candidatus Thermoplasmatota archaeon]